MITSVRVLEIMARMYFTFTSRRAEWRSQNLKGLLIGDHLSFPSRLESRRLRVALIVMAMLGGFTGEFQRCAAQDKPQLKRPQDNVEEKPVSPKKKNVKGPRAIGVLQLTGNGKGSL